MVESRIPGIEIVLAVRVELGELLGVEVGRSAAKEFEPSALAPCSEPAVRRRAENAMDLQLEQVVENGAEFAFEKVELV